MFSFRKKRDYEMVTRTINLLSHFHAEPRNNPAFQKRYKHLLQLQSLLKDK